MILGFTKIKVIKMAGYIQKATCPFIEIVFDRLYLPRIAEIRYDYFTGRIDSVEMEAEMRSLFDYFEFDTKRLTEAVLIGQFGDDPRDVRGYCEVLSQIMRNPSLIEWCPGLMDCKYFRNPEVWISVTE